MGSFGRLRRRRRAEAAVPRRRRRGCGQSSDLVRVGEGGDGEEGEEGDQASRLPDRNMIRAGWNEIHI